MTDAADTYIPSMSDCPYSNYNVPGWSDLVSEKHDLAREAFLDWIALGKPHNGAAICRMRRTRAAFKLALRYCKQHEDENRADACANSIQSRDTKTFWRNFCKVYNSKASNMSIQ